MRETLEGIAATSLANVTRFIGKYATKKKRATYLKRK